MEHPDSKEAADEKGVSRTANNAESSAISNNNATPREAAPAQPWPNTAIERQIARAAALRCLRTHQQVAIPTTGWHKAPASADLCRYPRFGLKSFLALFFFVAAGLVWVFTDPGRPRQKAVSAVAPIVGQTPANAAQTTVPKKVAGGSFSELSIPIADVSLRSQPDLLAQLVQFYRSKLSNDPNDSALTALNRLREQSLSELEATIAHGDNSAVAVSGSLQLISRLFPELADDRRYKYLSEKMQYSHRQATDEPAAKVEPLTPLAITISPEISVSAIAPEITVSAPLNSLATKAKLRSVGKQTKKPKAVENAAPLIPEIDAVSITQGRMIKDQFAPNDDGNVLMVEISYRNFDQVSKDQSRATLVTRLGIPEDPMVFAEVPVAIVGDRGKKVFLTETLMPGNTAKKYQLNFHLNGEFLASRMVRLSEQGH